MGRDFQPCREIAQTTSEMQDLQGQGKGLQKSLVRASQAHKMSYFFFLLLPEKAVLQSSKARGPKPNTRYCRLRCLRFRLCLTEFAVKTDLCPVPCTMSGLAPLGRRGLLNAAYNRLSHLPEARLMVFVDAKDQPFSVGCLGPYRFRPR